MATRDVGKTTEKKVENKADTTISLWKAKQEYPQRLSESTIIRNPYNLFPDRRICSTQRSRDLVTCSGSNNIWISDRENKTAPFKKPLPFKCHQVFPLAKDFVLCASEEGNRTVDRAAIINTQRKEQNFTIHPDLNGINLKNAALVGNKLVYIPQFKRVSTKTLHKLEVLDLIKLGHQPKSVSYVQPIEEKQSNNAEERTKEEEKARSKQPLAITGISQDEFALAQPDGRIVFCKIYEPTPDTSFVAETWIVHPSTRPSPMLIALSTEEVLAIQYHKVQEEAFWRHELSYLGRKTVGPGWEWKRTVELVFPVPATRFCQAGDHLFYQHGNQNVRLNLITLETQKFPTELERTSAHISVYSSEKEHFVHFGGTRVRKYVAGKFNQQYLFRIFRQKNLPIPILESIVDFTFGLFKLKAVDKIERQITAPIADSSNPSSQPAGSVSGQVGDDAKGDSKSDNTKRFGS